VAESVVTAEEKEEGVAVIDIGSGVTDIAIYHGGALCYMVSIPIGGSAINADIRHYASQLPMPAIESLKRVYGSAMVSMTPEGLIEVQRGNRYLKPIPRHNLASIIEARMTDIADYVWNEIREANFAKKLSAGIVLTGGVANLKNVAELFQSVTGIETRVACAELGITTESLEIVASPNLTLAVSLLLRGAQKGATPVSILQRPIQEPVQPEKPAVVVEPVKEPKQEVKSEEKVVTPPTSLNEKLAQQEQEKTTPVEEEEEKEIDIIENDDTTEQSWWSKFKTKIQKRFDDAFQNPDEEDDDDNDEY
jgi:cell division protein FtsA